MLNPTRHFPIQLPLGVKGGFRDWTPLSTKAMRVVKSLLFLHLKRLLFSHWSCVWFFCNPMDCSPPGSSVHGTSQVRILEWVAISFSRDLKSDLLHWQAGCLPLSHQGSQCFSLRNDVCLLILIITYGRQLIISILKMKKERCTGEFKLRTRIYHFMFNVLCYYEQVLLL